MVQVVSSKEALERVRQQLKKEDRTVSPSLRAAIDVLMLLVKQGLVAHTALEQLFAGVVPAFMRQDDLDQAA